MLRNLIISGLVGGIVGSLLTALFVSPITAQREDTFGEIRCEKLIVGYDKRHFVNISKYGIWLFTVSPEQDLFSTSIKADSAIFNHSEFDLEIKNGVILKDLQNNKLVEIGTDIDGNGAVVTYDREE